MTDQEKIYTLIDKLELPHRIVEHPAVFTVAESQQHLQDKRPIKNLLVKERGAGRMILVIMDGNTRLDLQALAAVLGAKKLSFASPETLLRTLGVTPGSVSVFGLVHDGAAAVEVVIDEILTTEPELGFHPNDNTKTIFMPAEALIRVIVHTGHEPRVIPLTKLIS